MLSSDYEMNVSSQHLDKVLKRSCGSGAFACVSPRRELRLGKAAALLGPREPAARADIDAGLLAQPTSVTKQNAKSFFQLVLV